MTQNTITFNYLADLSMQLTTSTNFLLHVLEISFKEMKLYKLSTEHFSLSAISFQPVLHDWCNKGRGMYNPVCGMMHIKEPLLLIGKSSPCGESGIPLSLSEWSFTICPTPYNRK